MGSVVLASLKATVYAWFLLVCPHIIKTWEISQLQTGNSSREGVHDVVEVQGDLGGPQHIRGPLRFPVDQSYRHDFRFPVA